MRIVLISAPALATLASVSLSQQFTVVAGGIPGGAIWTNGVELVDIEGDGDIDVLFANGSSYGSGGAQQQHLFLNNGAGVLTAAHASLNVADFNAQMVIAEDFDNDGDLDLMYAPEGPYPATTQLPRMLINSGAGVFSDQSAARLPALTMASFCVAAGDVDNDGDLDVVFTNGGTFSGVASQARLYLNNGSGFFTDATAARMPVDTYNAQDVTLLDWDGDYDIDIALSGKGGTGKRSRLYLNNGAGTFSISNALDNIGTGQTYEIDFGDLDGDNDADALVQSISGQNEGWARNDGPTVAAVAFTFPTPNGQDDNEMAGVDYDNDGDLDVFVASLSTTEKVYRNTSASFASQTATAIQAQTDSTLDFGFADLNGDNRYDMVTGQGESGNFTNKWYANNGPADTVRPTFVRVEQPAALSVPTTVFRAQVRDAIADDGHVNVTVGYSYTTVGGGSGSGQAVHQGSGQFRAAIPVTVSTSQVTVIWTATDAAGNARTSLTVSPSACTLRNGSGINPVVYTCLTEPKINTTWQTSIGTLPGTIATVLAISPTPDLAGSPNPFGPGEILISLAPFPTLYAGLGAHAFPLPNNSALVGKTAATQGFRADAFLSFEAANAVDVIVIR